MSPTPHSEDNQDVRDSEVDHTQYQGMCMPNNEREEEKFRDWLLT